LKKAAKTFSNGAARMIQDASRGGGASKRFLVRFSKRTPSLFHLACPCLGKAAFSQARSLFL
jgi:hypothetical protein